MSNFQLYHGENKMKPSQIIQYDGSILHIQPFLSNLSFMMLRPPCTCAYILIYFYCIFLQDGMMAMHIAACSGRDDLFDVIEFLLDSGSEVDAQTKADEDTILHLVPRHNIIRIAFPVVLKILEYKPDVFIRNRVCMTYSNMKVIVTCEKHKLKIQTKMKRMFKQWWSTISPISAKRTIASDIKSLNMKKTTT